MNTSTFKILFSSYDNPAPIFKNMCTSKLHWLVIHYCRDWFNEAEYSFRNCELVYSIAWKYYFVYDASCMERRGSLASIDLPYYHQSWAHVQCTLRRRCVTLIAGRSESVPLVQFYFLSTFPVKTGALHCMKTFPFCGKAGTALCSTLSILLRYQSKSMFDSFSFYGGNILAMVPPFEHQRSHASSCTVSVWKSAAFSFLIEDFQRTQVQVHSLHFTGPLFKTDIKEVGNISYPLHLVESVQILEVHLEALSREKCCM